MYDSTKNFKLCGAGLGISANGLKALHAISPEACKELEETSRKAEDNQPTLSYDDEGELDCQVRSLQAMPCPHCKHGLGWLASEPKLPSSSQSDKLQSSIRLLQQSAGNCKEVPSMPPTAGVETTQRPIFIATGWYELHQLLLKRLREGTVQLGTSFKTLQETGRAGNAVTLTFWSVLCPR